MFEHIAINCAAQKLNAEIVLLIASNSKAFALQRAQFLGIKSVVISPKQIPSAIELEQTLLTELKQAQVDLVCLAGYLLRVPAAIIQHYSKRIINIHPALLPAFGGHGMYGSRVHQAVIDFGAKVSGATVHLVDEEYDHGPIIAQRAVFVREDDTVESLAERVHAAEFELYLKVVTLFAEGRVQVQDRHVTILPPHYS